MSFYDFRPDFESAYDIRDELEYGVCAEECLRNDYSAVCGVVENSFKPLVGGGLGGV